VLRSRRRTGPLAVPRLFWPHATVLLLTIPNVIISRFALGTLHLAPCTPYIGHRHGGTRDTVICHELVVR
jgi:hypothetical protein